MKNILSIALFSIMIFINYISIGQNALPMRRDTLVIFETIYIYDTLRIIDTIRVSSLRRIDPILPEGDFIKVMQLNEDSRSALLFSIPTGHSATFLKNSIIPYENLKNSESMKKLSFIGVVLFAFNSMVVSQTNYGLVLGGGTWWAKCNHPVSSKAYSPVLKAGGYFETPLNRSFSLRAELNYQYLMNNYSYKSIVDTLNCLVVGEGESASNYHQFSIPVHLEYSYYNARPFIGVEFGYRISDTWLDKQYLVYGIIGGINFKLTESLNLNLYYHKGLKKDLSVSGSIADPSTGEILRSYDDYWKSNNLSFSLYLKLRQLKKTRDTNALL